MNLTTGVSEVCGEMSGLGGNVNVSRNKASQALDRTVSELQATVSRLEMEISAVGVGEVSWFINKLIVGC